ncbi:MAG: thioredoxin family protein [Thiovulaceae bacterium]|nr:thioredoxin family protein [Sulfurimonadaceae bacterium]MDD3816563.1 thioredoxin family protein [Sulfurimonadaceae bacterium]
MQTLETIENTIQRETAVMVFFSSPTCSVCHVLKPKLIEAVQKEFKLFKFINIDISKELDTAAHYGVFSAPTVLVFFDGKEFIRKTRNMGIDEVVGEIRRPYEIMTS